MQKLNILVLFYLLIFLFIPASPLLFADECAAEKGKTLVCHLINLIKKIDNNQREIFISNLLNNYDLNSVKMTTFRKYTDASTSELEIEKTVFSIELFASTKFKGSALINLLIITHEDLKLKEQYLNSKPPFLWSDMLGNKNILSIDESNNESITKSGQGNFTFGEFIGVARLGDTITNTGAIKIFNELKESIENDLSTNTNTPFEIKTLKTDTQPERLNIQNISIDNYPISIAASIPENFSMENQERQKNLPTSEKKSTDNMITSRRSLETQIKSISERVGIPFDVIARYRKITFIVDISISMKSEFDAWKKFISSFSELAKDLNLNTRYILVNKHNSLGKINEVSPSRLPDYLSKAKKILNNMNIPPLAVVGYKIKLNNFPITKNYDQLLATLSTKYTSTSSVPIYKNKVFAESLGNGIYLQDFESDNLVIFIGDGLCYYGKPIEVPNLIKLDEEINILRRSSVNKVIFKPFGYYNSEYFDKVPRANDIKLKPGLNVITEEDQNEIKKYFTELSNK